MKIIKIIFFLLIFQLIFKNSFSVEQNLKFVDVDALIENTDIGKKILIKLNQLDQNNIKKLKDFENELKNQENQIKLKKNLISEDELKKEIDNLNLKFADYKKIKNDMITKLSETKKNESKKFFKIINPIIQNYMNENSVQIILNTKNIFMGNKKSDLTQILINEINNQLRN